MGWFLMDERRMYIDAYKKTLKKNTAKRKRLERKIKEIKRESRYVYERLQKEIAKEDE